MDVILVVEYSGEDLSPVDVLPGSIGTLYALNGEISFLFSEKLGGCGGVDEEEVDHGSEGDGRCALYLKSVRPFMQGMILPMMNSNLHGARDPFIWVMPYAKLDAKVFARGDMPSKIDIRRPSSLLLYRHDKKNGAPAPNVASKIPRKMRVTINWVILWAAPEHIAAVPQLRLRQL